MDGIKTLEQLSSEIDGKMDQYGVATFCVVFRDPDTQNTHRVCRGDTLWMIGALTGELWRAKKNWGEE